MLTIVQWMNKIGAGQHHEQTPDRAGQGVQGPAGSGAPPTIQCGKYPEAPAVCNDQTKFYNYKGKGQFEPAGGLAGPP